MTRKKIENLIKYSIYSWINFKSNSSILCINIDDDVIEILSENNTVFKLIEDNKIKYDYILCNYIVENGYDANKINNLYDLLKEDGIMYLGANNKLGLRYICGEVADESKKLYEKKEILSILNKTKFIINKSLSILPNIEAAQLIYDESFLPNESLAIRYIPIYKDSSIIYAKEEQMFDEISKSKSFHNRINNYLFVCSKKENSDDLLSITLSPDRGDENFCITKIYKDRVEKCYPYNNNRISNLLENDNYLLQHGIKMVRSELINNNYVMPFINGISLINRFEELLLNDFDEFLKTMDLYRDVVYSSSKIVAYAEKGPILERCYIDLVPLNCFWVNNDFLFYDQEFYYENYPANLILWRAIIMLLYKPELLKRCTMDFLFERYGFINYVDELEEMSYNFTYNLRNKEVLTDYNKKHCIDYNILGKNIEKHRIENEEKK